MLTLLLHGSAAYTRGDELFVQMEYRTAMGAYAASLAQGADSAGVFWRLARAAVCLGDVSPAEEADSLFRQAEHYARECIRVDSAMAEGHTWTAAALGSLAMKEGARSKVRMCREIKQQLETALRLNAGDDIALSILGTFYRALGSVSWFERQLANILLGGLPPGGYEEAESAFLRAIALGPDRIRHHSELGMLYVAMDRPQDALPQFQKVLELPVGLASDRIRKAEAREFIEKLEGRN